MKRKFVATGYKSSVIMVVELVAGYRSLSKQDSRRNGSINIGLTEEPVLAETCRCVDADLYYVIKCSCVNCLIIM